jgi:hypothetical protein
MKSRKKCQKRTKIDAKTHENSSQNARKRRQIVENGVDQVDLGGVGTSGNEKKRKNSFSLFLAYFRARSGLFSRRFPGLKNNRPAHLFLFFVSGSGQLQPDLPGLHRFRQFVGVFVRFCNFCINLRAFLTIFSRFFQFF